jgi:hypothetical protein
MDTNEIKNRVDNAENDREMAEAVDSVVEDIAIQLLALWSAAKANPYAYGGGLVGLMGRVEDRAMFLREAGRS